MWFGELIAPVAQMPKKLFSHDSNFGACYFCLCRNGRGIFFKKTRGVRFLVIVFAFDLACLLAAFGCITFYTKKFYSVHCGWRRTGQSGHCAAIPVT